MPQKQSLHLHLNTSEYLEKEPSKVSLQAKNPYGDFSQFEENIEKMKPISAVGMPKEQAAEVAR